MHKRETDSEHMQRALRMRLRLALAVSWWERLVERFGIAERWEWQPELDGLWRRYWRRNGSLPRGA